jgi:hypothetical protein
MVSAIIAKTGTEEMVKDLDTSTATDNEMDSAAVVALVEEKAGKPVSSSCRKSFR